MATPTAYQNSLPSTSVFSPNNPAYQQAQANQSQTQANIASGDTSDLSSHDYSLNYVNALMEYGANSPQVQTALTQWQNAATKDPSIVAPQGDGKGGVDQGQLGTLGAQPDVDPRLTQLGDQETALATSFTNSIPQTAATFADTIAQTNKSNLAASIENNNASYNSRGLLYSGGLQGANENAQEQESATQAQDVATENQNLQTTSNELTAAAEGTQAQIATAKQNIASGQNNQNAALLNTALQNQATNNATIGGAAKGLGAAAGYGAGLLSNTPSTPNTSSAPTYQPTSGPGVAPTAGPILNGTTLFQPQGD